MNCTHETTEFRRQKYRQYGETKEWQKVKQCLNCGERLMYSDKSPFWPEDFEGQAVALPPFDYRFLHTNEGKELIAEKLKLRNPCRFCNNKTGFVVKVNMQHVAYCDNCGTWASSPSKTELGMKNEFQTRMQKQKQNQRSRIFARDGARCVICGKTGTDDALHVAHIISDHEGQGLSKKYSDFPADFVYSDYNLFVCCSECNIGQGKESLAPKLAVFVAAVIRKNMENQNK